MPIAATIASHGARDEVARAMSDQMAPKAAAASTAATTPSAEFSKIEPQLMSNEEREDSTSSRPLATNSFNRALKLVPRSAAFA